MYVMSIGPNPTVIVGVRGEGGNTGPLGSGGLNYGNMEE